jgi:predicted PurR-regulated permease PerM
VAAKGATMGPGDRTVPGGGSKEPRFRKIFALVVVTIFSALFLRLIWPFIEAVLLAAVLSGMMYPLNRRLRAGLGSRRVAAALAVLIVFVVIIVPLLFLIGAFAREAARLSEMIAPWIETLLATGEIERPPLPAWIPFAHYLELYQDQIVSRTGDFLNQAGSFLIDGFSRLTQGTVLFVLNLFILLYAMFFFFLAGGRWLEIFDYLPLTEHDRELVIQRGVSIARATIKGTLIIGIVQGGLAGAAFAVVGLPGPIFWGVVMTIASIIPAIGAAIVWLPAVIYLIATDEIARGVGLLIWCAGVVSTIDNVLRPRLIGSDTKMPDLLILLSTLGGIAMFGATGLVLGPIVAGFFITSWHIFSGVFREELRRTSVSPPLLDEEIEGLPRDDSPRATD